MSSLVRRYVPIAGWLPGYDRAWLSEDAVATVSVWALLVPQAIAYASVAGMPPQYGLYAPIGADNVFPTVRSAVGAPIPEGNGNGLVDTAADRSLIRRRP